MLYELEDSQWEKIKDSLPGKDGDRGRSGEDNRGFIRLLMWGLLELELLGGRYQQNMANGLQYIKDL